MNSAINASPVLFQGFLMKKSPKKVGKVTRYQKRYFVLKQDTIEYYHSDKDVGRARSNSMSLRRLSAALISPTNSSSALGVILIKDIADVRLILHKHEGCRFDIVLSSTDRIFKLRAPTASSALRWTEQIAKVVEKTLLSDDVKSTPNRLKFNVKRSIVTLSSTLNSGKSVDMQMSTFQSKLMSLLIQGPCSEERVPPVKDEELSRQINSFSLEEPPKSPSGHRLSVIEIEFAAAHKEAEERRALSADADRRRDSVELSSTHNRLSAMEQEFLAAQRHGESRRSSVGSFSTSEDDDVHLVEDAYESSRNSSRRGSMNASPSPSNRRGSLGMLKAASLNSASLNSQSQELSMKIPSALMKIGGNARLLSFLTAYLLDKKAELAGMALVEFSEPIRRSSLKSGSRCPISGCLMDTVGAALYCSIHEDKYDPPTLQLEELGESKGAGRERIFNLFMDIPLSGKIELLKVVFTEGNDCLSQGLALRLLWVLLDSPEVASRGSHPIISMQKDAKDPAMSQTTRVRLSIEQSRLIAFAEFTQEFASGEKFSEKVREALLDIAFPKNFAFYIGSQRLQRVSSVEGGQKVAHTIMSALEGCTSELALETLEDLNLQFMDRPALCQSLWEVPYWQEALFDIIQDLSLSSPEEKKIIQLVMNLVVILHHHAFLAKDSPTMFYNGLCQSMRIARETCFKTLRHEFIGRTMLSSLVSKIASMPSALPLQFNTAPWDNLLHLQRIVWKFVFTSPHFPHESTAGAARRGSDDGLPFSRQKSSGIDSERLADLQKSHQRDSSRNLTWLALVNNVEISSSEGDAVALGAGVEEIGLHMNENVPVDLALLKKACGLFGMLQLRQMVEESVQGDGGEYLARLRMVIEFMDLSLELLKSVQERARVLTEDDQCALEQFVKAKNIGDRRKIVEKSFV